MADRFTRSGNPGLNDKTFANQPIAGAGVEPMTLPGTINKSFLLLMVLLLGALWPWSQYLSSGNIAVIEPSLLIGAIGGLVLALIISFKANTAPYLALPYAALEGLAVGAMSAVLERRFPGIALQAVGLTFGVFAAMLIAYRTGLIRATERFRAVVIAATGGIVLVYLATMVLSLFHVNAPVFSINDSSPLSIGVSLLIVGIAALNLILDFNIIETGVARSAPRYMEWYCAFGLLVTLVWLYMEILRLLAKMRRD
ncbi:MAG TPA: Bax inhibitor-1/YccA family protein [Steroidobacteraceae bacterium]|nr:Bax inhibitor-1/YccA family protein [Steroidobacteraceae bacterium]